MRQRMVPDGFVVMTIEISDSVAVSRGSVADVLAAGGSFPVWVTPSVVIPQENNVVLFPDAERFDAEITGVKPFRFDPRLIGA